MALIIVNSAQDDTIAGDGFTTLREAVIEANADELADSITFDASLAGQILLLSGQLIITNDVSIDGDINGDNRADITLDGGGQRILKIQGNLGGASADVDLKSLTLTNGVATPAGGGEDGGAVYVGNNVGSVDILDSTFSNNSATFGGGAIHVQSGVVTIVNSLFTGNTAGEFGGAIRGFGGDINIINSTISGNSTIGTGGGIFMEGGNLTMTNSTVTLNRADTDGAFTTDGGGLFVSEFATAAINSSVISGNTSGSANVENSISGLVTQSSSFFGPNALLGALQDNGGTVLTHAPLLGSPLINAGNSALLPADTLDVDGDGNIVETLPLDGRGQARNADGSVDIGAVESPDYLVTTSLDTVANDGFLSLREALNLANANADANNIFFATILDGDTIILTNSSGDLDITQGTVTIHGDIEGDGQLDITLSGGNDFGFFNITGAATTVVIDSLNMVEGNVAPLVSGNGNGVAAYAIRNAGTLTLSNSQIADTIVIGTAGELISGDSSPGFSGGNAAIISSSGTLNIVDTIIRDSTAFAGAGSLGGNGAENFGVNGFDGGAGGHGAVIISSGILNLQNTLFDNVAVTAGAGGQGGNGVSYYDPILMTTRNGRGGDGGRGGDADLIRNAGTVVGEFGLGSAGLVSGAGGAFGNGINGRPNGNPGSPGSISFGIRNIGGGTSAGVDDHDVHTISLTTTGVDNLPGSDGDFDMMWGMNGNDILNGLAGDDDLAGGAGNDQLFGGDNDDTIEGGLGNDIMDGGFEGVAGDTLTFAGFRAAAGSTQGITVNLGYNFGQHTGAGYDTITGFENVIGSDFNDSIIGSSGINIIRGGLGNDSLQIDRGHADVAGEVFDGGAGEDALSFVGFSGVVNLRNDTVSSIQAFSFYDSGAYGSTTIQLNANQFSPTGIALNAVMNLDTFGDTSETFDIAMGSTTAFNLSGITFTNDTSTARFVVTGDGDAETITGSGIIDTINGNAGDDTIGGGAGGDTLDGGANGIGGDTVSYAGSTTAVTVNLGGPTQTASGGHAAGDVISNFENVTGSAHADTLIGNAGANILNGGIDAVSDTLTGLGGNDTYIINSAGDNIVETAGQGAADRASASVSFVLAAGDNIEFLDTTNAAGLGLINLTGNEIAQTITGNAGVNILNGGIDAVSDTLTGLGGNDTYIINSAGDNIVELAGQGAADRASASVSFVLAAGDNIEFLDTTNASGLGLINLTGNEIAQTIAGNFGANILNGGIDAVSDILVGRLGNDTYIINSATDNIVEAAGEGTADRASASLSFILAAGDNIEFLDTTNAAGLGAINLTGNEIAQTIAGNFGANILNGGIDAVSDILVGRAGNDTYIINSATDNIVENAGEGTADRASASLSFILAAGDNIEFLDTTNAAGLGAINLTGNEIAQTIAGNAGANILNGGVDALSDILVGRAGNDTYIINTATDNIVENAGEGTADRASASLSFILAAGDNIEFLDTTNAAGLGAINLIGNEIAQTIAGNAGANILNGGIDALSDILVGRAGNDTYIINSATDNIVENAGEGLSDRASASLSFALAAGDNIEFLDTTNAAGLGLINLTGNEIAQTIIGNAGANILNGMFGNDTLTGGLGADSFLFNTTPNSVTNRDVITDFNVAADSIQLENTGIFTALGAVLGVLDAAMFKNLTTGGAVDATDRILYDDVTGAVSYDSDGSGATAAIQFATLTGAPTVTNADFFVI